MNDREFAELIEQSSLGTRNAKRRRREGDRMIGINGQQARINDVHRQERESAEYERHHHHGQ
jgi:hypothetical protein